MEKAKEKLWPPAPLEKGGLPSALYQKGVRGVRLAWPPPGTEGVDQGRPQTVAYVHGQPPEAPVEPMWPQQNPRPLRERVAYLLARYPTWYRHEAPHAWRERHRPEPTLEALLEWGGKRAELLGRAG